MQTKNAINKVTKKGYKITEEKGLYTFIIDGRNYSFRDQDGTAILFSTHFEGAVHPEFFSNLTQLIKFAESRVSDYGQVEQEVEEVEEVEERKNAKYKVGTYVPRCGKITEVFPENNPIQYEINKEIFAETVVNEAFTIFNDCAVENIESDYVSEIIKKHWILLKKSVFDADSKTIEKLLYKYQIEAAKGTGGIGSGPGKVKEPRRGVQQLVNWARHFHIHYEENKAKIGDVTQQRAVEPVTEETEEAEENKESYAIVVPESKSSFREWLEILIEEKGVDIDSEIEIEGHYGLTYESLVEFLEGVPEYHEKIKNTLITIDFNNGDIFHYIKHLTECMIKSCGYDE